MISYDEVFKIGKLTKPHGVKGELSFAFENDIFDRAACPYLVCMMDGILVPFFVEEYRFKGSETALIKFEDTDTEEQARRLSGAEVYFPKSYLDGEEEQTEQGWDFFMGFGIEDEQLGYIGVIEAIDQSTVNTLFLVRRNSEEWIIPAAEDLITGIDAPRKILKMNLPDGLFSV
ncbi:MAG: ribosome maturation factor RimM [Prevotella sp.]|jgi:16S rRNA processing protein RimM|nr:ribosome maturation factor RimM [Prevotella sp.]